jgi:hypothetical protein
MFGAGDLLGRALRAMAYAVMLVLGLALVAANAEAGKKKKTIAKPEDPPMRFMIVRSSAPGCEPNCPEWISAEGRIYGSTSAQFKKILKQMGSRTLPVIVNSPGGDINAAMRMGRMIRAKDLDVAVGYTTFTGCKPSEKSCKPPKDDKGVYRGTLSSINAFCFSACPLILAGGKHRVVGIFASAGVHRVTSYYSKTVVTFREWYKIVKGKKRVVSRKEVGRKIVGSYASTKIDPKVSRSISGYLKEMGIGPGIQRAMESTPADQIHVLTMSELTDSNLIQSPNGSKLTAAELYGNADLCKAATPERNCVKRESVAAKP